jgi:DNA-binding transcriptional regulator YdaS (Cro superfamily)
MAKLFSSEDRKRIAARVRLSEQYLYQCLTARREMGAAEARRVERDSGGEIRPWDVCQSTWHEIWPELIGTDGAPAAPVLEAQRAA